MSSVHPIVTSSLTDDHSINSQVSLTPKRVQSLFEITACSVSFCD
jgi:hypothetical protein